MQYVWLTADLLNLLDRKQIFAFCNTGQSLLTQEKPQRKKTTQSILIQRFVQGVTKLRRISSVCGIVSSLLNWTEFSSLRTKLDVCVCLRSAVLCILYACVTKQRHSKNVSNSVAIETLTSIYTLRHTAQQRSIAILKVLTLHIGLSTCGMILNIRDGYTAKTTYVNGSS